MPEVLELSENIKHYIVNGYCFENEDEYRKALKEKEGIKYLNSKIVFDDINKVTRLYEDLIDKDVFTTQIGIEYMRKLRTLIIKKGGSMIFRMQSLRLYRIMYRPENRTDRRNIRSLKSLLRINSGPLL